MDDRLTARQIEVLRDLGLSRAEAEVYLACLALGAVAGAPFSSYRVAQDMGRDPANIGKIFNGLVRLQAVRVVQEGPRLFAVVPPDEFAAQLLGRVRRQGAEAVTLLDTFGPPAADGVALALTGTDQAYARARDLLAACRHEALVSGSPDALRELGAELEQAASLPGRRVRVLSPEPMSSAVVEIGQLPPAGQVGQDGEAWLHLVVDGQAWLTALLPADADGPVCCGWWCRGSGVARVLAESLETCWRAAVAVTAAPVSADVGAAPSAREATAPAPRKSRVATTETPATVAPATETPVTETPVTEAPMSQPSAVEAPVTEAPATGRIVVATPQESTTSPDAAFTPGVASGAPAAATAGPTPDAEPVVRGAFTLTTPSFPSVSAAGATAAATVDAAAARPASAREDGADPWGRAFSAEEADRAGFTFLFRHRGRGANPKR